MTKTIARNLFVLLVSGSVSLAASTFNVKNFGAKGDGFSLDTLAFQNAVNAAQTNGGGVVLVPQGQYKIDPITLASGINLHLEAGAVILLDDKRSRYPVVHNRYQDGITATGCHDVQITGSGTIDGLGEAWWQAFRENPHMTHRPYLVKFQNCTNLTVTGVTFRNSPMFHLVTENCTDVKIFDVTIHAPEHAPNTDGIDPSGWNYQILRCHIDTGDDDIAIKPDPHSGRSPGNRHFVVKDCVFGHGHGMSVGGGSAGGLEDLRVTHCSFNHTDYGIRIKTLRGNGGLLQNCLYENLQMTAIQKSPISIQDYYPESNAPKNPATETTAPIHDSTPINRHLIIRNLNATDCPNAGILRGLPEAPIEDVTFENVHLSARSGMVIDHARAIKFLHSSISTGKGPALITYDAQVTGLK